MVSARITRRDQHRYFATALEARIDQVEIFELRQCLAIVVEMVGLPPHRLGPCDSQPREVFIDRLLELRLAAGRVDVLDAQQEFSTRLARHFKVEQRRQRMAEMQVAIR